MEEQKNKVEANDELSHIDKSSPLNIAERLVFLVIFGTAFYSITSGLYKILGVFI